MVLPDLTMHNLCIMDELREKSCERAQKLLLEAVIRWKAGNSAFAENHLGVPSVRECACRCPPQRMGSWSARSRDESVAKGHSIVLIFP